MTWADELVLVEAESFQQTGGWVVDQQVMDQMGSPYLLAHGLGVAVQDALTKVTLPSPGKYRVWVRTRDWVAPWNAPGAPGKFQLLVDGEPLETTFGIEADGIEGKRMVAFSPPREVGESEYDKLWNTKPPEDKEEEKPQNSATPMEVFMGGNDSGG